jgi:hypothetical protein
MIGRRQLLLGSISTAALVAGRPAFAFLPVILAALAAIAALAVATGKAANAIDSLVNQGKKLASDLASIPEWKAAQDAVSTSLAIRREVVSGARQSQAANAKAVSSIKFYLATRDSNAWGSVIPEMKSAVLALGSMAKVFREKAVWFPTEAQDSLAQLSDLYDARVSIMSKLEQLSAAAPPNTDDELSAWHDLVEAYDRLRVQSLKLIVALNSYTS